MSIKSLKGDEKPGFQRKAVLLVPVNKVGSDLAFAIIKGHWPLEGVGGFVLFVGGRLEFLYAKHLTEFVKNNCSWHRRKHQKLSAG